MDNGYLLIYKEEVYTWWIQCSDCKVLTYKLWHLLNGLSLCDKCKDKYYVSREEGYITYLYHLGIKIYGDIGVIEFDKKFPDERLVSNRKL